MKAKNPIQQFNRPVLFYTLSTLIPWSFWFAAGYISQITPYQDKFLQIASLLSFIGLLTPLAVVFALTAKHKNIRRDITARLFNFSDI